MPLPLGHVEVTDQYGQVAVHETLKCGHCQRVYRKPGPGEPSGFCHMCFRPVCLPCGANDRCDPFEKKLERMEQRGRFLRAL